MERVSCERIIRLRSCMPDESPIDLDAHAAMIAYDVEHHGPYEESQTRRQAQIDVTKHYVEDVHRFLDEIRRKVHT